MQPNDKLMKKYIQKYYLIAVGLTLLRFFMNIYDLDIVPNGFTCDEAANGYDAYCIAKTGKDMYGNPYPFLLNHHFMDYIEPLYNYILVIIIKLFGYNIFNVRLLSAIIGAFTIYTTFVLGKTLFNEKIGLIAATLLVFSPWHFVFSRIAFRAIFIPLLSSISLTFLFKSINNKKYLIYVSIFLGLMLYTYSISKAFVPLLVISYFLFYRKRYFSKSLINANKTYYIFFGIILSLLALPIYYFSFFSVGNYRFHEISIFSTESPSTTFYLNYIKHLGMLITGGSENNESHEIYGTGKIYWEYFLYILLAVFYGFKFKNKKIKFFFFLFLICFIPSSLTNNKIPHILRSISIFPIIETLSAYGIYKTFTLLKDKTIFSISTQKIYTTFLSIILLVNAYLVNYFYFNHYRINSKKWFDLSVREDFYPIKNNWDSYDNIIVYGKGLHFYRTLIYETLLVEPRVAQNQNKKSILQWYETKEEALNSTYAQKENIILYDLNKKEMEFR